MQITEFKEKITSGEKISFQTTMAVIDANFNYEPTTFSNGTGVNKISNAAGSNEGSCKIFALGQLLNLNEEETLAMFGDYYWVDVLQSPDATDHQNIRTFMKDGWAGIKFEGTALTARY